MKLQLAKVVESNLNNNVKRLLKNRKSETASLTDKEKEIVEVKVKEVLLTSIDSEYWIDIGDKYCTVDIEQKEFFKDEQISFRDLSFNMESLAKILRSRFEKRLKTVNKKVLSFEYGISRGRSTNGKGKNEVLAYFKFKISQ